MRESEKERERETVLITQFKPCSDHYDMELRMCGGLAYRGICLLVLMLRFSCGLSMADAERHIFAVQKYGVSWFWDS